MKNREIVHEQAKLARTFLHRFSQSLLENALEDVATAIRDLKPLSNMWKSVETFEHGLHDYRYVIRDFGEGLLFIHRESIHLKFMGTPVEVDPLAEPKPDDYAERMVFPDPEKLKLCCEQYMDQDLRNLIQDMKNLGQ